MRDVRKDHQTILRIEDPKFDVGLQDDIFSERNLKRKVKDE